MNCLTYALGKWWAEGGYLLIRRSVLARDFGVKSKWHPASWIPHFLHRSKGHVVTQYLPTAEQRLVNAKRGLLRSGLGLWSFDGKVTGDDNAEHDHGH